MTFVVDGTVTALVAILVQVLLKPLLEIWLKPDAPNHDTAVRAMALLLGVLLLALDTLIGGPWPVTGNAWLLLVGSGALSGVSAVGAYHIFSGSASPTVTASVVTGTMPTGAANGVLNLPRTLTEAANNGRQGMPASLVSEGERTATLPPAGTLPQSPSPEPTASAAPPAQA